MSHLSTLLIASIVSLAGTAHADTFGGWQYAAPPGYTRQVSDDRVAFTKQTGATSCSLSLFEARAIEGSAAAESSIEWHNVVTHAFSASVVKRATVQTKQGVTITATTAKLGAGEGDTFAATHYVVMPPGMVGSALLTSNSLASLRTCERAAMSFVSSLAIDWSAPKFTDPEARVETPIGQWATVGPTSREYTFASDGTYRFHSEGDRVVDEAGTYAWIGNQLTLKPRIAKAEKTTYTWGKRYVVETGEWQLVLTPRKATKRDGQLPADASYRYSDHAKPVWTVATEPGA